MLKSVGFVLVLGAWMLAVQQQGYLPAQLRSGRAPSFP